ncbi:hypothetical protein D5086_013189 [Populus alba]
MRGSTYPRDHQPALAGFEHRGHPGRIVGGLSYGRTEMNYGSREGIGGSWSMVYRAENVQVEELNQLDLSLRL